MNTIILDVYKNELEKSRKVFEEAIFEVLKDDSLFFNRNNLLICNHHLIESEDTRTVKDFLFLLGNKFVEVINEKIKKDNFTSTLYISKLRNTSNTVDYLNIELSCKIDNEYLSLLNYKVYSYNKYEITLELFDFAKTNNFNDSQKLFLNEYIDEASPDSVNLDNFLYIFEESLINSLSPNYLAEYLEPTIESAVNLDYSSDIHKILVDEDSTLNLFKDKLKVIKCENGYDIFLGEQFLKGIKYKLSFI